MKFFPFVQRRNKGFTLVELLLVIALVGVLSTMGVSYFSGQSAKARDAKKKADLSSIGSVLEIYRANNGKYPVDDAGAIKGCDGAPSPGPCAWGSQWAYNGRVYMRQLPKVSQGVDYKYVWDNTDKTYYLCADLEKVTGGNSPDTLIDAQGKCGGTYDYGIGAP